MTAPSLLLPSGTFQPRRYKPGNIDNWSGHLPFARDLVLALRPHLLVELGTHWGESYFGFCQVIAEHDIPCVAYSVDTWTGEAHSGVYDESVYNDVAAYNEVNYKSFSYLLRCLFDEALSQFADESIDILHIDGLHTFDAVAHDFAGWSPKVRPGGIVLFHDIAAKHADFGVWKLWEQLKSQSATFEFHHSWGLGVFEKQGNEQSRSAFLDVLLTGDRSTQQHLRRFYFLAALELEWKHSHGTFSKRPQNGDHLIQVFSPSPHGYSEESSQKARLVENEWQSVAMDLPYGLTGAPLRIDFSDTPAIIDLRGITIRSSFSNETLWTADGSALSALEVGGTLLRLDSISNGTCRLFSYGSDPQFYLPHLSSVEFDQPVSIEIWLRFQTDLNGLLPFVHAKQPLSTSQKELSQLVGELQTQQAQLNDEKHFLSAEYNALQIAYSELAQKVDELHENYRMLANQHNDLANEYTTVSQERASLQASLADVLKSRSWRVTWPVRRALEMLKGKP